MVAIRERFFKKGGNGGALFAIESGKGKRNKHAVSLFGNNMGSDREPTIHKLD